MKHILFFILLFISAPVFGQTLYTTGVTFCAGVPVHNPGTTGAKWALDTTTWNLYVRSYGTTWTLIGNNWIQNISGCAAPAYTPTKHQSKVVINACDPPELYAWDGAAWDQIGAGSGGITGTGLANRLAYWTAAGAIGYESTLLVDTVNNRLMIGSQSAPTTTLDVDGNISLYPDHTLAFKDTSSTVPFITVKGVRFLHTLDNRASTLTSQNLFLGYESGNTTMTGFLNIGIGRDVLKSITSGTRNLAIGPGAGDAITTGTNNFALGENTLGGCSGCGSNVAVGVGLLRATGVGDYNVVIGEASANGGSYAASSNVIVGGQSGQSITSSANNVLIGGRFTGLGLTTGGSNILIGNSCADDITTGTSNVIIGTGAASLSSTAALTGTILLGHESGQTNTASNVLYIENSNSSTPLIGGSFSSNFVGINTTVANIDAALEVTGTGATSSTMGFDVSNSNDSIIIAARNDRRVGINTATPDVSLDAGDNTDAIKIPSGTTAQEPAVNNTMRFNSDRESLDARENGVVYRLTSSKTPSIAAGAAAGTGPTIAVAGNDLSMKVTLTTGTTATTGALFTVTYASSMDAGVTNYPVFSCADVDCTGLNLYVSAESNTAFTISTQNAPTDAVQYIINIHIGQ